MTKNEARSAYLALIRQGAVIPRAMRDNLERLCEPDDEFASECRKEWEFVMAERRRIDEQNRRDFARMREMMGYRT